MNFTLTPGVYAALNLLSKATRNKVLDAAFAFVLCGARPTNLSKNLLVMFMMVVDSATEGKLTYLPDEPAEEKLAEETAPAEEWQPEPEPAKPAEEKPQQAESNLPRPANVNKEASPLSGIKKTIVRPHHRKRNCRK